MVKIIAGLSATNVIDLWAQNPDVSKVLQFIRQEKIIASLIL